MVDFSIEHFTKDNIQYFSGRGDIKKAIYHPFIHMEVLYDSGNDTYDLLLLNKTFNGCEALNNRKLHVFLNIAFKTLERYIQIPKRCPLPKVKIIVLTNSQK